jgi:hypothetical protein
MSNGPLTPGEDAEPTAPAIDYSPASVPYSESFENALMNAILYPSSTPHPHPLPTPPMINPTTLPVPLTSPLRTHTSPIPGILLTHPHGYYTGGPGPTPHTVTEFASRFIDDHGIQDAGQLERVVEGKVGELLERVRSRMGMREDAVRRNEEVRRAIVRLDMERESERRVQEKMLRERREKRG